MPGTELIQEMAAGHVPARPDGLWRGERLNHLHALESESIYILREAAAEFARPVMLFCPLGRFSGPSESSTVPCRRSRAADPAGFRIIHCSVQLTQHRSSGVNLIGKPYIVCLAQWGRDHQ